MCVHTDKEMRNERIANELVKIMEITAKRYTCKKCGTTFKCDIVPKFCVGCGNTIQNHDDSEHYLIKMKKYLNTKGLIYNSELEKRINDRKSGRKFGIEEHITGLIYSQLSNQTEWSRISPHLSQIDKLFFHYDIDKILSVPYTYFVKGIYDLKCGNISTEAQMKALNYNISQMRKIEHRYGSMDAFVMSAPAYEIVEKISGIKSPIKFKQIGPALAWEYLRNVGVDGAKPDTHTRRFLGADRMGNSKSQIASPKEVYVQVERLSAETNLSRVAIDNIIWSYCANGFGAICTATPKCNLCVVRDLCKYCP